MLDAIEVELYGKDVSDFQLSRLVRASHRKYSVPITAFISDAFIAEDTCVGISFGHSARDDAYRNADGTILRTGKIHSARKEGRFWLLETRDGYYVIGSFMRDFGRRSFLEMLQSGERC
ncbi:hypothetical protein [Pseudomonas azerbaijanorientalis]|uniref:hypothetical protein n=1 Tax=Pseudomonas azerbaijanorientalis TaxID=2842350 RepID=UPI001C3E767A|nr:hypothetical protein [Pseudomonas azerbaijanorientalis]QXH59331.1 hypothetical protein KSS91_14240 [Pseudomonas azerbaijanorientalis]